MACSAVLMVSLHAALPAQQRPAPQTDTLSARVRDSLIAAVLADTLDEELGEQLAATVVPTRLRQAITLRPTFRRYTVGNIDAQEQSSFASYVVRGSRASLRVDMTPVVFTGDTSLATRPPQVSFGGVTPINARVDLRVRSRDTLRVFVQSMSFPGALSNVDALALGSVGTSTIDLDAGALGIAARTGLRYTVAQPIGDNGVSLTVRGGVEYDPKPTGTQVVSWRGTTVRGGIGLNRSTENAIVGASVEVTRSFADSLGGRNLFPGGGNVSLEGRALRYLGVDGDGLLALNAFYSQPMGIERPEQPTRLIPLGNFMGVTGTGSFPVGSLTLLPVVSVLRESSSATAMTGNVQTRLNASGYTATGSLGLSVPIGRALSVTPEIGVAYGSVGQTTTSAFPRRVGRPIQRSQGFTDAIRGGWVALEFAFTR